MQTFSELSDFVVLDIESTGFSRSDRVIEIGIVVVEQRKITRKASFFLNPGVPIPPRVVELTGITQDMLKGARTFDQVADWLRSGLEGKTVVAHSCAIDKRFLKQEFEHLGQALPESTAWLDSLALFRTSMPGLENHKLPTVLEYLGVNPGSAHRAGDDAEATAKAVLICLETPYPSQAWTEPPYGSLDIGWSAPVYFQGDASLLDQELVGVVGPRAASPEGLAAVREAAAELARSGAVVVSGGALGADAMAHTEALVRGGKTIVVLPCPLGGKLYPSDNVVLFQRVLQQGGLLLSLHPTESPGERTYPTREDFLHRNRLLVHLCRRLISLPASSGGTAYTLSQAKAAGRPVTLLEAL